MEFSCSYNCSETIMIEVSEFKVFKIFSLVLTVLTMEDSYLSDEDSEFAELDERYFRLRSKYQNKLDSLNTLYAVSSITQYSVPVSPYVISNQSN